MIHEQCESGITLRGLRRAFCGELRSNPELVEIVGRAAGLPRIDEVLDVTMKGHGEDLTMLCRIGEDDAVRIRVMVHIDSTHGKGNLSRGHRARWVRSDHRGQNRVVTIAPAIWFAHSGNAAIARNAIMISDLDDCASHDFWLALHLAKVRAQAKFAEFAKAKPPRPKGTLPWWVARRMRENWR
jgi:hypothetical protein